MRTLSSPLTVLLKFVFPMALTGVLLAGTWGSFFGDDPGLYEGRWLTFAALIVGAPLVWLLFMSLKRVRVSGGSLYVSNYFREIEVPLSAVTSVHQQRWPSDPVAALEFERDFGFGTFIHFIPNDWTGHMNWLFSEGPVVRGLRQAVEEARRPPA